MTTDTGESASRRRLFPTTTHVYLAIYGALYLLFVIVGFVPSQEGSPVSDHPGPYHPFGLEGILVKVFFAFFLIGFFTAWRNRLAAGVLFLLWWAGMCGFSILMIAKGSGGAFAMPFPVFVIGLVFLVSGYRERRSRLVASKQENS